VKEACPEYRTIHSQVLQEVLRRVDRAFGAFFRRVAAGQTPGYPRFRSVGRYDSLTYPQYDRSAALRGDRLTLGKIPGPIKVRLHRPVQGTIKTVTIRRDGDQWYVCFSVVCSVDPLPSTGASVGLDLGLTQFATLSTGEQIANPRPLRRALRRLKQAQQRLSRCQRHSHRRNRARRTLGRLHRKVRNQRLDFMHKVAHGLVNRFDVIVFEDLTVLNLVQNHTLALAISDASWSLFQQITTVKAVSAGRVVLRVNPAYTSQLCSGCGRLVPKALSERWHSCAHCGTELDRDVNAAINIFRRGCRLQSHGTGEAVSH
jgi:putative transposase